LKKFFEKKKMNYFLLLHKNKNYVSDNKNLLLQKADELVSGYILDQMTQTGASYKYEKVIEEDDEELKFIVTFRNCNVLSFNQAEEVICQIVPVHFIEDSSLNRDTQTNENNDNTTEEVVDEKNEETNDIIEEDSFEKIENTQNTQNTNNINNTEENNISNETETSIENESFHSKEE